jgi:hypothetical protein
MIGQNGRCRPTFLPLLMASQTDIIGLLQRAMFTVAYIWYGREAFSQLS